MTVRRSPTWRNAQFIAIDIETTGLDGRRDEVISFAGIPIEAGRIIISQAVHGLVRPRAASTGASAEIHGLRDYDLAGAETAPDALASLAALIHGRIPVVHVQWVERTFLRKAGCPLPRRIVDTAVLWRLLSLERGERDPGTCSLSAIAGALALPASTRSRPPRSSWLSQLTSKPEATQRSARSRQHAGACAPGGFGTGREGSGRAEAPG